MKKKKAGSHKKKGAIGKNRRHPVVAKAESARAPTSNERALIPYDPLQLYLYEIKQYSLLTREEEKELGVRIRENDDEEAAFRLVTSNLRLVVKNRHGFSQVLDQEPVRSDPGREFRPTAGC